MRRLIALVMALALLGLQGAGAQQQLPGGRFFDDNETTHEGNIEAIAALGITLGCVPQGTAYCPQIDVTRAQMATFVARALDLAPLPNSYDDVDPISSHAGNIAAIRQAGITLGCNALGTRFCPNDAVTRAQMASFLVRAFEIAPRTSGPFTDAGGTHHENINGIAHEGITVGCNADGTLFCPDNRVTRGQMASFLGRGLGLEPVEMIPRLALTAMQSVCSGSTPVCSGTSGGSVTGDFYVQEGWFYNLPYIKEDGQSFSEAEFRLFVDDERITDVVITPATDLFGTMVALEGYVAIGLAPGLHTIVGEWWWDGEAAFTSVVVVTVSG